VKYLLLIQLGDTPRPRRDGEENERAVTAFESLSDEEKGALFGEWKAINETPGVTPGSQLQPADAATTVRVQDGKTLTTDGPFVETKEALGGYLFFEADDLDAAIELASRIPAARMGGSVEVRPIVEW
jgi:hypothetical protein